MTVIYNYFVKRVQKIFVGNYEPIMGICGKIFIINLRNLQMLFMLWITYKFSECLVPLHKHERPQWKSSWWRFCPRPQTRGACGSSYPQIFSCFLKFCCAHKHFFQTYDKNKNLSALKMHFPPPNLIPGCRPDSAKTVPSIRIFCFEGHSVSRCTVQ